MFARGRPQVSPTDTHINIGRELVFSADVCYNGREQKAFLREEGGTRSVTEGARGRPQVSPTDTHVNIGRELVSSADLCYNEANKMPLPLGEVAAKPTERVR